MFTQNGRLGVDFFIPWLLTATITGVICTNCLQSVVVVPEKRVSELLFDEMVDQNYTFLSMNFEYIKGRAWIDRETLEKGILMNVSIGKEKWDFLRKEKILAEKIQGAPEGDDAKLVNILVKKPKMAYVETEVTRRRIVELINSLGYHVAEGKESFLSYIVYTTLGRNQKPMMLRSSTEWLKASGVFYHFLEKVLDDANAKNSSNVKTLQEKMAQKSMNDSLAGIGLTDNLVAEAFILLMYCITSSLLCIILELLLQEKCRGVCWAWISVIARRLYCAKAKTPCSRASGSVPVPSPTSLTKVTDLSGLK